MIFHVILKSVNMCEYKNMLDAEAPEKEAARKWVADTVVGDKCQ